jgi:ATP-dependent RNA helicase DBP3
VQACTWPPALEGRDVIGIAETGSGKTLAFGIPALSRLLIWHLKIPATALEERNRSRTSSTVTVLVVAPTRELALQTHDTLSTLGAPFGIASVAVFGGVDKAPQIKSLANANKDGKVTRILVGTPGRILDLVNDGACDLSRYVNLYCQLARALHSVYFRVNYLVLDEADRMLDKGFENDVRNIISHTRPQSERQTMMCKSQICLFSPSIDPNSCPPSQCNMARGRTQTGEHISAGSRPSYCWQ